jgi:hypothetical protein
MIYEDPCLELMLGGVGVDPAHLVGVTLSQIRDASPIVTAARAALSGPSAVGANFYLQIDRTSECTVGRSNSSLPFADRQPK